MNKPLRLAIKIYSRKFCPIFELVLGNIEIFKYKRIIKCKTSVMGKNQR